MPVVLIGVAIAVFLMFTNPIYSEISTLKAKAQTFDEALNNSKALENERDVLTAKYNAINPDDLMKLQKLLPENVDNIRLILEIEQIASPYGMVLKDVRYDTTETTTPSATGASVVQGGGAIKQAPKDYGVFELSFSTTGSYNNFINFTKNLESNLRIVDIGTITFSSDVPTVGANQKTAPSDVYTYNFKIKTYWLKN